jgi:DNA gyrase subunit A
MRARVHIEEMAKGNRNQIVVTELPYQVNKASLVEKMAELVRQKKLEGIADLRDESDRHGMRIVIELKRESQPRSVLNQLYKHTAMQSSFAVNMLALVDGQPRTVSVKKILESYIQHRHEVIRRRSEFDLEKAKDRAHVLEGLLKAIDMLDEVIKTIRGAPSADEAKTKLMAKPFGLTERQAQAVLDMQLRRLAALERKKIEDEYKELKKEIEYLEDLLANPRKIDLLVKDDALELKKNFGDERRTHIMDQEPEEFSEEDMVAHMEVVVTISERGYIKRVPLSTYRAQRRGGVGIIGTKTKENDFVRHLLVADTHDRIILFTDRGRCFQLKTYEIADESRMAKGESIMQLLQMNQDERITALVRVPPAVDKMDTDYMLMGTKLGEIKKTPLKLFANVRKDGLIAMDLEAGDEFVGAKLATDDDDAILVTSKGQAVRFPVRVLRSASRTSGGVRGVRLLKDGVVVALEVDRDGEELLVVTERGFGKRTVIGEYPVHGRGGQGVITFKPNEKTGDLIAGRMVKPDDELMLIATDGVILRTTIKHISQQGRSTQGVTLMDVADRNERVAAVSVVDMSREFDDVPLPTGAEVLELKPPPAKGRGKGAAKRSGNGARSDEDDGD